MHLAWEDRVVGLSTAARCNLLRYRGHPHMFVAKEIDFKKQFTD
jgi:hypothetical protein